SPPARLPSLRQRDTKPDLLLATANPVFGKRDSMFLARGPGASWPVSRSCEERVQFRPRPNPAADAAAPRHELSPAGGRELHRSLAQASSRARAFPDQRETLLSP